MQPSLLLLLLPARALAQDATFDAHGFTLAALDGDVRDPLEVQRAGRFEQWDWFAGGALEFAKAPLVLVTVPAEGDTTTEPYLDNLFALNLSLGVALHERFRLDASVPLVFTSSGNDGPQGVGLSDPRLTAMIALVRPAEHDLGFGLGLAPYIDLPIGAKAQFLGDSGLGGGGVLAGSYALEKVTLGADVGLAFRPALTLDNLNGSDGLVYGLFLNYLPKDDIGLTLETRMQSPFTEAGEPGTQFPAELMLSARKRYESGAHVLLGASTALSEGASAARYRLFLGGGFGHMGDATPKDTDLDGIVDPLDACPTVPETVNGYKDEDGCPDSLGTLQVIVRLDGKEVTGGTTKVTGPDGTANPGSATSPGALIPDVMPGTTWTATATYPECFGGSGTATAEEGKTTPLVVDLAPVLDSTIHFEVVDTFGNKIPGALVTWDGSDAPCAPMAQQTLGDGTGVTKIGAGTHKSYVTAPGYATVVTPVKVEPASDQTVRIVLEPARVKMTEKQIVILEKVYFEYDKDVIKPESFKLLDEVAATIMAHPELGRIEVAGHTDSDGNDAYNLDLSQRRVDSVLKYLSDKGVDVSRLLARGYGETRPVASNKTKSGKAENRRVEFNILGSSEPPKP
jgi:outer membrane protein OmpA-like peptidoglycan-associated protein